MNVNKVLTKNYENKSNWTLGENKPNTKPIQTQSNPIFPPHATKQTQSNPICRGVASAASPPRRGEAGSKPIYVELTKTSKGANSMFFNIIKEQSEEKDALLRVVSALDGMAEYCVW